MSGGIVLNNGAGGNTLATDRVAGIDYQEIKIVWGAAGSAPVDVTAAAGLPIQGAVTIASGNVTLANTSVISSITNPVAITTATSLAVDIQDGAGNKLTSNAVGNEIALCVQLVDNNGNPIVNFSGTGGTSQIDGTAFARSTGQLTPIGALVESANPTLVAGNIEALSLDPNGNLRVAVDAGGAAAGVAGTSSPDVISVQGIAGAVPILTSPVPSSTPGSTRTKIFAAATTNAQNLKSSAGVLLSYMLSNLTASVIFIKFFDKATTPVPGSDTPAFTFAIPTNGGANCDFSSGIPFLNGIGIAITNLVADADATPVTAASIVGMLLTK